MRKLTELFGKIKTLAFDTVVYGLSLAISRAVSILILPFMTQVLGPADYGIIGMINNLNSFLIIFMVLGMENAIHRWYWEHDNELWRKTLLNTWLCYYFTINAIVAGLLAISADTISVLMIQDQMARPYILLFSITLPLQSLMTTVWIWLRLQGKPIQLVTYTITTTLVFVGLNYALVVHWRYGLIGFYYSYLAFSAVGFLWSLALLRAQIDASLFKLSMFKDMLRFSYPLLPGTIGLYIINLLGIFFVQRFRDTTESGLYQMGSNIASGVALFVNAFIMAWLPFAMSIQKQDNAKQVYARTLIVYVSVTSILFIGIAFFSNELLMLFTNPKFYDSALVAALLSLVYVLLGLIQIANTGLTIMKISKPYGFILVVCSLISLALNFWLVSLWGKIGAAIACLAPLLIAVVYLFTKSQQSIYVPYNFGLAIRLYVIGLIIGLAGFFVFGQLSLSVWQLFGVKLCVFVLVLGAFAWFLYRRYGAKQPVATPV
jgi:O-antigen/teichoic acid export membrane protein